MRMNLIIVILTNYGARKKNILELELDFVMQRATKSRKTKSIERCTFKDIFIRVADNNKYFNRGKGYWKNCYAVYLSNNNYKNTNAVIKYIRETEYKNSLS